MSVCTSPAAETFGDVTHCCQMSRDERWAVLNRNTFQDILNSILTQTPTTPLVFSAHSKAETNPFTKSRLRKLCSNGSGSAWSEKDNFEDFDRYDSPKTVNKERNFSGRNRVTNNVVSSMNQTIESINSKKDTAERSRSNAVSTGHVMLHMGPDMRDYFDHRSDSRSGALSFSKHESIIPVSSERLENDPKLFASRFEDCESAKSAMIDVDLIGNAKLSANRNGFYSDNSSNSDEVTYFPRDKRKLEKIVTPEFNNQGKSDLDCFTRDVARKTVARNEKVFGRHRDVTDPAYTDSINNTDCDTYRSSKQKSPSTHKQHSPRASSVYNSPTPTTTESFPFRVPLPFVHPKLKPLGIEPPFNDLPPKLQSPRDLNELDVYKFAFNLCATESESYNTDEKNSFQNSLNRLHDIGIRHEFYDRTFERSFNRPDYDLFSKYAFSNQFEFFNMIYPLRLFPGSMQIESECDLGTKSTGIGEGCVRNAISNRLIEDISAEKAFKVERSDYSNRSLSALYTKNPTTPSARFISDNDCQLDIETNPLKCSRVLQTSQTGVNSEELDRSQELSFDLTHTNNNNNNNRSQCKDKIPTNEIHIAQNKIRVANDNDIGESCSNKVKSHSVASKDIEKNVSEIVTTDSSASLSNIIPSNIKKSKNHSVLAILGPLLCESTDRSVSPVFSPEDTRATTHISNNETLKFNDDSSDSFRPPNIFKRNLVTGIYGSSSGGRETTAVWLAVSKDVLYNLMDRLLYGERGQIKECTSEERCGDGQTWRVGFSRSTGRDYPGMSRSGPIETWLRRSSKKRTNSFKSVRYQLHCDRPFITDPSERNYKIRSIQSEKRHLSKSASEEIDNVNMYNLKESCLSASSDGPLELTCRTTLPAVRVTSDVTETPVLRSLLDDDDVFMTSPTRNYHRTNTGTVSPIQCQLKTNKFNFTSSVPTAKGIDISTGQSSLVETDTADPNRCSPPRSCREDHAGTYAVTRKRKLCELLTRTDSDEGTALSKVSEAEGTNKTDEGGADDCVRLRSMKWKSSMLLRLREEINSDETPGQTN